MRQTIEWVQGFSVDWQTVGATFWPLALALALVSVIAMLAPAVASAELALTRPLIVAQAVSNAAQAAEIVKARHGGQILSVHRQVIDGQHYFRVKTLLSGGRVKVVRLKARNTGS